MKNILPICLLVISFSVLSQKSLDVNVVWSENGVKQKPYLKRLAVFNDQLLLQHRRFGNTWIHNLNLDELNFKSSKKVVFEYNGITLDKVSEHLLDGEIVYITSYNNRTKNTINYFAQTYSVQDGLSKPILLQSMTYHHWSPKYKSKKVAKKHLKNEDPIKVSISPDKKSILVMTHDPEVNKDSTNNQKWSFKLFDSQFNLKWEFDYNASKVNDLFMKEIKLSNEGIGFILGLSETSVISTFSHGYPQTTSLKSDSLYLISIDGEKQLSKTTKIDTFKDEQLIESSIGIIDGGILIYGISGSINKGLSFNKHTTNLSSTFFIKMDAAGKVLFKKRSKIEGHNGRLNNYYINDYYKKKDGGFIFTAEQYYYYTTKNTTEQVSTELINYHYGDIVVVSCNPKGEVIWKKVISKSQNSTNDEGYFSSFYGTIHDDKFLLIYNDSEFNFMKPSSVKLDVLEKMRMKKNNIAVITSIDMNGELKKEILFDFSKKSKKHLVPICIEKTKDGNLIILTREKGSINKIGDLEIPNF